MPKELTEFEENLVELVHFLAFGSKNQAGLTLREVVRFLHTSLKERKNKTPLDLLSKDGRGFINDLKTYINESED